MLRPVITIKYSLEI